MSNDLRRRRFEAAITPHLDGAYSLARSLSKNGPDAEDIVQEAVLRAYRYFDGWHGGSARVWFLAIVRNTYRTWVRGQAQPQFLRDPGSGEALPETDLIFEDNDPETHLIVAQDRMRVTALVATLPSILREVIMLRDLQELSFREVAMITRLPIATVQTRLARARDVLRERWHDCGGPST